MRPHRRVFVIGGAHTDFLGRDHPRWVHPRQGGGPTLEQLLHTAILGALADADVAPARVDRLVVGNFLGELFAHQGHLSSMAAAAHPDLDGTSMMRVEAACASGGLAVLSCAEAIQAGADVTVAVGAEIETNVRGKDGVEYMALAAHTGTQRHLDFALFPYLFAVRARAYKEAFGASAEDIGQVVVKAYANATDNPKALKQAVDVTLSEVVTASEHNREFLEDPAIRGHMRILECTDFTDGASAAVIVSEDGLRSLGLNPSDATEITGFGSTTRALGAATDPTRMVNLAHAAAIAYEAAGIGPDAVELAEVHDCFAISELQAIEALGLAEPGQAPRLHREGHTQRTGRIPVNPGGGLLGFGHPVGATGVKQVVEVHRQLSGTAPDYPLPRRPRVAVTANLGGDDRTGVVMVHQTGA